MIAMLLNAIMVSAAAAQEQWRYTALGDSLVTGYTSPTGGYVHQYRSDIQSDTGAEVTLYNLGQNGWTSSLLLNGLRTDLVIQTSVNQSNVITWNIGINDVMNARNTYKKKRCGGLDNQDCLRSMTAAFKANWSGIVSEITYGASPLTAIIRSMDVYNPWVKADKAKNTIQDTKETGPAKGNDFQVLKYYLDDMNAYVAATNNTNGIPTVGVYSAFNGADGTEDPVAKGLIHADGLHPNEAGFQLIADKLRSIGYAPLR